MLNPATEEVIATMQASGAEDVDRAVAAAKRALPGWAATTPGERARALLALADRLETHADELADLEAANAGKPRLAFLEDELPFIADNLRFFAGAGRLLEGRAAGEYLERRSSIIRREPGRRGGADHPARDAVARLSDRPLLEPGRGLALAGRRMRVLCRMTWGTSTRSI